MSDRITEARHARAIGLDALGNEEILSILADAQVEAARVCRAAIPVIARAADMAAKSLSGNGRLIYAGAGSSGLMAMADALELPGTYGIALDRVVILLAGGRDSLTDLAGGYEDDTSLGHADAAAVSLGPEDTVISVSASGRTPYAIAVAEAARAAGSKLVTMANNTDTPLGALADCEIVLATPPEVIAGSTRMGAGTAQKIAFNMFSTLLGVRLGHVHDGMMVNLRADNDKLRDRAARMVSAIAGVEPDIALKRLAEADGSVKVAVLMTHGLSARSATQHLGANGNNLRSALAGMADGVTNA